MAVHSPNTPSGVNDSGLPHATRRSFLGGLTALPLAAAAPLAAEAAVKTDDESLTAEKMAAMEFEPWVHTKDEWKPPTTAEWIELEDPDLVSLRIAWHTMHMSKSSLIEGINNTLWPAEEAGELFRNVIEQLQNAQRYFGAYITMLEGAETRMMCALASAEAGAPTGGAA